MLNNINLAQIKQMASEIANLLDANEENSSTRGNNQIEASIWNKFVGQGDTQEVQIGNGKKSLINEAISLEDAKKSISTYILMKGVDSVSKALAKIGINWTANSSVNNTETDDASLNMLNEVRLNSDQIKKTLEAKKAEAKAKYEGIEEQKNTIKASNGMTYNEIQAKISEFKSRNWGGVVYDEQTGKPRFPKLDEIITSLEIKAKNGVEDAQAHLDYIKGLIAAKEELEAKYPDMANNDYIVIEKENGEKEFVEKPSLENTVEQLKKAIENHTAEVEAKFAEVKEQKNTIKASNGMTYNEIQAKIGEFKSRNWGGVIYDEKTGKPRFPSLDDIVTSLEIKSKNGNIEAKAHFDYINGLIAAKEELEAKYPDFAKLQFETNTLNGDFL